MPPAFPLTGNPDPFRSGSARLKQFRQYAARSLCPVSISPRKRGNRQFATSHQLSPFLHFGRPRARTGRVRKRGAGKGQTDFTANRHCPFLTSFPAEQKTRTISQSDSAAIGISVFMLSSTARISPARTRLPGSETFSFQRLPATGSKSRSHRISVLPPLRVRRSRPRDSQR